MGTAQVLATVGLTMMEQQEKNMPQEKLTKTEILTRLVDYLEGLQKKKFTGSIKINFSQGSIGRIEKFEDIAPKLKI